MSTGAASSGPIRTRNTDVAAPLVLSVPHGGRTLPARYRTGMLVDPRHLWSDWYSAELFDVGGRAAMPTVLTRWSRFVADPNRAPRPPLHGGFWTTPVPATDPGGTALYACELEPEALQERLDVAHAPYHAALDDLVAAALARFPRLLLLDLHTFGLPLGVDAVLGDGDGTTASAAAVGRVEGALRRQGLSVARNLRFRGGHVVRRWAAHERVDAVQVELDQRRYLCREDVECARPMPRRDRQGWARTRAALCAVVAELAGTP